MFRYKYQTKTSSRQWSPLIFPGLLWDGLGEISIIKIQSFKCRLVDSNIIQWKRTFYRSDFIKIIQGDLSYWLWFGFGGHFWTEWNKSWVSNNFYFSKLPCWPRLLLLIVILVFGTVFDDFSVGSSFSQRKWFWA